MHFINPASVYTALMSLIQLLFI